MVSNRTVPFPRGPYFQVPCEFFLGGVFFWGWMKSYPNYTKGVHNKP